MAMIKVIFLFRFRSDMEKEDVRRWWLNDHGALALKNLGMRRYVQNHFVGAIDAEHAEAGMGYDGCVEVWFDDLEAYERTMASPEWKALEDDGPNGLDMTTLMGGFVNEHVMRWDAAPDQRPYTSSQAPAAS
jgi:uncharacterized protein (TIGR02118 family)